MRICNYDIWYQQIPLTSQQQRRLRICSLWHLVLVPDWEHMVLETFSFKKISVLFVGQLIPLFWTSGDICPGFQSQSGSPHLRVPSPACNGILRFTFWCNICWPLGSQHGSQVILIHKHRWARVRDLSCHCLIVWYLKPTSARNQAVKKPKMMASFDSRSCHGTPMCAYSQISFFHSSSFHAADAMSNSSTLGYPSISHLPNVTYKTNTNVQ